VTQIATARRPETGRVKDGRGLKVWIPEEDASWVKSQAALEGRATSHVVRDAIREYRKLKGRGIA
jgi:uncharacterized protein YpmB